MTAGRHLIIDGVFNDSVIAKMSNREYLTKYLEDVTAITGMTLVFPPIAMSFPFSGETCKLIKNLDEEGLCEQSNVYKEFKEHVRQRDTEGGGVSAVAIWVESHCTLHSWTEKNYISIDLFSCGTYEAVPVIDYSIEFLGLINGTFTILDRHMDGTKPELCVYSMPEYVAKRMFFVTI